mgnify:CR=1 FL=1
MRVLNGFFLLGEQDTPGPVVAGARPNQCAGWRPPGRWVCTVGASSLRATTHTDKREQDLENGSRRTLLRIGSRGPLCLGEGVVFLAHLTDTYIS